MSSPDLDQVVKVQTLIDKNIDAYSQRRIKALDDYKNATTDTEKDNTAKIALEALESETYFRYLKAGGKPDTIQAEATRNAIQETEDTLKDYTGNAEVVVSHRTLMPPHACKAELEMATIDCLNGKSAAAARVCMSNLTIPSSCAPVVERASKGKVYMRAEMRLEKIRPIEFLSAILEQRSLHYEQLSLEIDAAMQEYIASVKKTLEKNNAKETKELLENPPPSVD